MIKNERDAKRKEEKQRRRRERERNDDEETTPFILIQYIRIFILFDFSIIKHESTTDCYPSIFIE